MPTVQAAMSDPGQMADVPTNSQAELEPPAGATPPLSWTKNGTAWTPPATPVVVSPTPGKDDVYKAVDSGGTTRSVVVRWKPEAPANAKLKPGRANASVAWTAIGNERYIDYYEIGMEPAPSQAQLPRKVMRAAGTRGTKRVLSLDGLPPDFYTAEVCAVREGDYGPVASDKVATGQGEVLSTGGPYTGRARIVMACFGLAAIGGAIYLLVTDPSGTKKISLNGWALGTAALLTFALIMGLCVIVRVGDLLTGADNRISTSRVNVALWTVAIAFGITTLAVFAFGALKYHIVK